MWEKTENQEKTTHVSLGCVEHRPQVKKNALNEPVTYGFRCARDFLHVTGYAFDAKIKILMSLISYT